MAYFDGQARAEAQARNFLAACVDGSDDNGDGLLRVAKRKLAEAQESHDFLGIMENDATVKHLESIRSERAYAAASCKNCGKPRSEHQAVTWSRPFDMHTMIGGPSEPVHTLAVLCPSSVFVESSESNGTDSAEG